MIGANVGFGVSSDEKIRALEDVLQSETFSRSGRLKGLLRFLCEAEIEGREAELIEYTIGTMALGRPADFCPLEDSSVRSRAHELRQRLEKYYTSEAPDAPVRIELRKGSYVPCFRGARRDDDSFSGLPAGSRPPECGAFQPKSSAPPPEPVEAIASSQTAVPPVRRRAMLVGFAAGAAAMFVTMGVWSIVSAPGVRVAATHLQTTSGDMWTPELESLWRPFFQQRTPLLIGFETRFFVRLGPLMVRDWRVNTPDQVLKSEPLMRAQRLFEFRRYGNRDYTDGGTPQAVFCLTRLLLTRVPEMALKNSLDVTAADLRDNSVILLGKPGMDPEIEQALAKGELVDKGGIVVNVHPRHGEQTEYRDWSDPVNPDRWSQKYSVITMMPGSAPDKRILTLTASGSEQPAALAYFVTNPDSVRDLVRRMRLPGGALPDYFQVLVRAEYKSKAVVKVEYITHRSLKVG